MAARYNLKCDVCNQKQSFHDVHDIKTMHWTILAWQLHLNSPLVICPKCEYKVNKISKNEYNS